VGSQQELLAKGVIYARLHRLQFSFAHELASPAL